MESKHAYCILAHDKWGLLQRLIELIDDERNDIYLHVDAKGFAEFNRIGDVRTKVSNLHIIDNPVDVEWSDVSLCDAEVKLYNKVLETGVNYQYVHLLSGSDLPVMSQDSIHEFFNGRDEEFIDVRYNSIFKKRIKYYHFFVRGRKNNAFKNLMRRLLLLSQWFIIDRLKHAPIKYAYGSEWCSLTLRAVKEIVDKYAQYRYMFEKTTCSDEHYKQMILASSEKIFKFAKDGNLRYVRFDHRKASPRIITMEDLDEIMGSGCVFARKFQEGTEAYEKDVPACCFLKNKHIDEF
ncbi:MAG: hypothetical protein IKZ62_03765 [Prevotella sp.]|nr:hypothetical protein [Prevotella sp.]